MTKAWQESVVEYYGEEGEVFDSYADTSHLWTYVSHFHNVPFYVYSYAFADLVVGSLYGVYAKTPEGFEQKLLDLLSAGGVKGFKEALEPFGLDPSRGVLLEGLHRRAPRKPHGGPGGGAQQEARIHRVS